MPGRTELGTKEVEVLTDPPACPCSREKGESLVLMIIQAISPGHGCEHRSARQWLDTGGMSLGLGLGEPHVKWGSGCP